MTRFLPLVVLAILAVPLRAQTVEDRLKKIEERLERIEKLLEGKVILPPRMERALTIPGTPFSWVATPGGIVTRVDSRDGEVKQVHRGKEGAWQSVSATPYVWLLGDGGAILRLDKRDGETKVVFNGEPGHWELLTDPEAEWFAVYVNSRTGATIRLDRRDGDTRVVVQPKK